jgi:protein-S-isoprenylcysteine O-methyltransferase Ste14
VRHPIYALQVVMLAGAALLLPTLLSLGALVAHFCCVAIKAADEENYLTQVHGQAYRDYAASTGRLIPTPWGRSRAKAGPSQSD